MEVKIFARTISENLKSFAYKIECAFAQTAHFLASTKITILEWNQK